MQIPQFGREVGLAQLMAVHAASGIGDNPHRRLRVISHVLHVIAMMESNTLAVTN